MSVSNGRETARSFASSVAAATGRKTILHGGDYNPEQWLQTPAVIDADFDLAALAGVNTFTVGVFSWTRLEPAEGQFDFAWLDDIFKRMADRRMATVLATPSGARPAWLSRAYPEVLRVAKNGIRNRHEGRHNHCLTSPVYRERVAIINAKLAERYHAHPAMTVWHVSNEYSGECHCNLCYAAFRGWLRKRYTTLDALNHAWWTAFWSHTFTDWDQIEPVDSNIDGLKLDWRRFVSDQTIDFMQHEIAAIRKFDTRNPVTTNMMGTYDGIDYPKMAVPLDVAGWDAYPPFHDREDTARVASNTAFVHDLTRSLKGGQPFMLMETTPSAQNWQAFNKLKPPGLHQLICLQAVAHGADTVQYFQWRKNRGSAEKFHGAVVDHAGHANTRVFQEIASLGRVLKKLDGVVGSRVPADVAIIYDWENRWAIDGASGPRTDKKYLDTCESHYAALWQHSVLTDVINADAPLDHYKLVIAPMLYMVRPGVAERLAAFVKNGGVLVTTFLTGIADESDLCFLGGWPGPLRPLLGIWSEEIESLYDDEQRTIVANEDATRIGLKGIYTADTFCDVIQAESAEILATYGEDAFFAGRPAVTVNSYGKGKAIYLAARLESRALDDLYRHLVSGLEVTRAVDLELPTGVSAQLRKQANGDTYLFLLNFSRLPQLISLPDADRYVDAITGAALAGSINLAANDSRVFKTK